MHLDCEKFAETIVNDERCYSKTLFDDALNCMRITSIITESKINKFRELSVKLEKIKQSKVLLDLNDDAPEHFKDAIMDTLMRYDVYDVCMKVFTKTNLNS